jgi:hypothetical protein
MIFTSASYALSVYWPLYADRNRYREKMIISIKNAVGCGVGGLGAGDVDPADRRVFDEQRLDPALVTRRQLVTENQALSDRYDLEKEMDQRGFVVEEPVPEAR